MARKEDKFSLSYGFSAILDTLNARGHRGYERLEPEGNPTNTRIILDPLAPITWSAKTHLIQHPTPSDALHKLLAKENVMESKISSNGTGGECGDMNVTKIEHDEKDASKEKFHVHKKFLGIFLAAVSGLFFTLCSVTVKLLPRLDPSEILLFRALIQLVLTIPILICMRANPLGPRGVRLVVYLQGVVGCLTVTCIFIGFARLPVGDAATIIFCSPIFVMIFSHFILREHCGAFRFLVIGLLLVGVVLIARPPFLNQLLLLKDTNEQTQLQQNGYDVLGYSAALLGTLLTASNFVCMRRLREVHFSVLIFAFSIMSAVMSAVAVVVVAEFRLPETTEEWLYSVSVGVFGLLGQSMLAVALRYETAGVVSVTRSMDIAAAYVIQVVLFGDIPKWPSVLGALVVILAVFTMAMEDMVLALLKQTFGSNGWC